MILDFREEKVEMKKFFFFFMLSHLKTCKNKKKIIRRGLEVSVFKIHKSKKNN